MKTDHIKKFIEDVQAGGFDLTDKYGDHTNLPKLIASNNDIVSELLLNPEAWKAVGKTRGWNESELHKFPHWFIEKRMEGESVNDALGAIK